MKRVTILTSALCFIVAALVVTQTDFLRSDSEVPAKPKIKSANASGEDLDARHQWEFDRLRNPDTGEIPFDIFRKEMEFAKTLPVAEHGLAGKRQATSWGRKGPTNIGGRTRALAYDVSDETRILAGGVSGGMWLSTNSGSTWSKATGASQLHSVSSLVQDTRAGETSTWYAGTGEVRGNSASGSGAFYNGNGLYKSVNSGVSWSQLATTNSTTPQTIDSFFDVISEVAIDPSRADSDIVYVASSVFGAIVRSNTGFASSWQVVLGDGSGAVPTYSDVAVASDGTVYAAFSSNLSVDGMYKSTTGYAGSFADITPAGFPALHWRQEIAIDPSDPDNVWFLSETPGAGTAGHSLWKYDNGSGLWTDHSSLIPALGGSTGDFDSQGSYNLVIKVSPENSDSLFIGGTNLFRIGVGGGAAKWIGGYTHLNNSFAQYPVHHPDQHSLAFLPSDGTVMLSGHDGGVTRSSNALTAANGAATWTDLNTGYETTQFYTVCFNLDDTDPFVGGGMQDNGTYGTTSASPTAAWAEELSGDGSHCQVTSDSGSSNTFRHVSSQNGVVYLQEYNSGGTLLGWTRIDPSGASGYLFINPFITSPAAPEKMFMAAGSTVWRQSDLEAIPVAFGITPISTGWTDLLSGATGSVTSFGMHSDTLYFGTSSGKVYRYDAASTVTAGTAPLDISSGLPAGYVSDISVDPAGGNVMVSLSNYGIASVFYSSNSGATWVDVEGNLSGATGPSARTVALAPGTDTPYLVGTSTGIYSATSLAGGSTVWSLESASLIGNVVVDMIRYRPADDYILAGTHAHGTFDRDASLPIELVNFNATVSDDVVNLEWTASGLNAGSSVDVEMRDAESMSFETLSNVPSDPTQTRYSFAVDNLNPNTYVFRLKLNESDGSFDYSDEIETEIAVSGKVLVSDVYPNPMTSSAKIEFAVEDQQNVRVDVYDITGKLVRTAFNDEVAANKTKVLELKASGLPAGVYFARVTGEEFSEARKFTLVK